MTTVLCVPQWQGSASRKASRLVAGARRTAELVAADALVTVPVAEAVGDKAAGIRALEVLLENQRLTRQALAGIDDLVVTAGGAGGCWTLRGARGSSSLVEHCLRQRSRHPSRVGDS